MPTDGSAERCLLLQKMNTLSADYYNYTEHITPNTPVCDVFQRFKSLHFCAVWNIKKWFLFSFPGQFPAILRVSFSKIFLYKCYRPTHAWCGYSKSKPTISLAVLLWVLSSPRSGYSLRIYLATAMIPEDHTKILMGSLLNAYEHPLPNPGFPSNKT